LAPDRDARQRLRHQVSWQGRGVSSAHGRGVDVAVIIDHTAAGQRYSGARTLEAAGVKVMVDHVAGIAHNKVMIIDGARVITGSFNFTASAQNQNAENVVEIDDVDLADRFSANWASRLRYSMPYGAH
jgi:phospholipase D